MCSSQRNPCRVIGSDEAGDAENGSGDPAGECLEAPALGIVVERSGRGVEQRKSMDVAPF